MNSVYVTGDLHGDILKIFTLEGDLRPEYQDLGEGDVLIIAGDFCLIMDNVEGEALLDRLEQQAFCTCYVDGNHEDFPYLAHCKEVPFCEGIAHEIRPGKVYHLIRGEYYRINGLGILAFGGAASQDKIWRQPGKTWHPEESPSDEDYARCENAIETHAEEIDFVISHTAPTSVCSMMMRGRIGGDDLQLTNYLEELALRLPRRVQFLFGHFHEDKRLGGRFRCLMWDVLKLDKEDA